MAVGWAVPTDRAPVTSSRSSDSGASMRFAACPLSAVPACLRPWCGRQAANGS